MDTLQKHFVMRAEDAQEPLLFVNELDSSASSRSMELLTCYVPGILALGAYHS